MLCYTMGLQMLEKTGCLMHLVKVYVTIDIKKLYMLCFVVAKFLCTDYVYLF